MLRMIFKWREKGTFAIFTLEDTRCWYLNATLGGYTEIDTSGEFRYVVIPRVVDPGIMRRDGIPLCLQPAVAVATPSLPWSFIARAYAAAPRPASFKTQRVKQEGIGSEEKYRG